jgi:hypothetical protein
MLWQLWLASSTNPIDDYIVFKLFKWQVRIELIQLYNNWKVAYEAPITHRHTVNKIKYSRQSRQQYMKVQSWHNSQRGLALHDRGNQVAAWGSTSLGVPQSTDFSYNANWSWDRQHGFISGREKGFSLIHSVQVGPRTHPLSYSTIPNFFPKCKAAGGM